MISGWFARLTILWSIALPRRLDRFAPPLADGFADGTWIAGWRGVAAVLPILAFGVGVLAPGHWPGLQSHAFTSSLSFMMVAISGGILSGAVGTGLVIGYSTGDLLSNPYDPSAIANALWYDSFWGRIDVVGTRPFLVVLHYGALVISYVLLAVLVVIVPQFARRMSEELVERMGRRPFPRLLVSAALYAAACGVLVYLWSQAAVVLIRPLQTSKGSPSIPSEFFYVLQTQWVWLVVTAVLAAGARLLLENWATRDWSRAKVIVVLQQARWSGAQDRGGFWAALPRPIQIALVSITTGFLLAGIATDSIQLFFAALGIGLIQVLRYVLSRPLSGVTRIPLAVRFLVALGFGAFLLNALMGYLLQLSPDGNDFLPLLVGTLLMIAILGVLFPKPHSVRPNHGRQTS